MDDSFIHSWFKNDISYVTYRRAVYPQWSVKVTWTSWRIYKWHGENNYQTLTILLLQCMHIFTMNVTMYMGVYCIA